MAEYKDHLANRRKDIKLLAMDVDGTLTDGKVYIAAQGEWMKAFHIRDGYAIKHLLPVYDIIPAVITGRSSEIVEQRGSELDIRYIRQGVKDKAEELRRLAKELHISLKNIACIGDDLNDLPMMNICGIAGCPSDAVAEVKDQCDYVCKAVGGAGAVREFVEWLIIQRQIFS